MTNETKQKLEEMSEQLEDRVVKMPAKPDYYDLTVELRELTIGFLCLVGGALIILYTHSSLQKNRTGHFIDKVGDNLGKVVKAAMEANK